MAYKESERHGNNNKQLSTKPAGQNACLPIAARSRSAPKFLSEKAFKVVIESKSRGVKNRYLHVWTSQASRIN